MRRAYESALDPFSDMQNDMLNCPAGTICDGFVIRDDLLRLKSIVLIQLAVSGQPTGKRLFMRGCAVTLARRGLNNHTLSMFDRYDICRWASII
ncbi:hypothetical protein DICVIV_01916 [Dictyocaulus viviparus]|uniref:Uncharacterized protein n=1 Tax=Dictyocaulus viviparus TaxID=29172 RepID=A0A0D8Y5C2_DICVI|nr:hypothetical protein DICVIV_01916 [Dictyocaulus viviparus]